MVIVSLYTAQDLRDSCNFWGAAAQYDWKQYWFWDSDFPIAVYLKTGNQPRIILDQEEVMTSKRHEAVHIEEKTRE